jgi:thioredoxin reductase (NADPH)
MDKGCLCNSIFHYPAHMTFFTTAELLEIGDIPFSSINAKPTRSEALEYYRKVAAYYKLDVRQYYRMEGMEGVDGGFTVYATDRFGRRANFRTRKLALATGYYDLPNSIGVPGETLSKVHHYYYDPHPYNSSDVVVIGGKNSAAIAALELWRHGARVTLVHRAAGLHEHIKYTGSSLTWRIASRTARSRPFSPRMWPRLQPIRSPSRRRKDARRSRTILSSP